MQSIDEARLETDLGYRFQYLGAVIGFAAADVAAIHAAAPHLAPRLPALVEAVYERLHSYTCTWRHFLPRRAGFTGELPSDLELLTTDHPQIVLGKQHLTGYLAALLTRPYDIRMAEYLDAVGRVHTSRAGTREVEVPLVQMTALMGFVADALTGEILVLNLDRETEHRTLRAFGKLMWLQNDLIVRHYAAADHGPACACQSRASVAAAPSG
jgi:hypothetical protein